MALVTSLLADGSDFGRGFAHALSARRPRCRSRNQAGSGRRARKDSRIPWACRRFCERNHRQANRRTCQGRRAASRRFVRRRIEEITRAFVRRLTGAPSKRPRFVAPREQGGGRGFADVVIRLIVGTRTASSFHRTSSLLRPSRFLTTSRSYSFRRAHPYRGCP